MSALAFSLIEQLWPVILTAIGGLAFIWQQRRAGAKAERARQAARESKSRDIRDQVQNDVGAMPPDRVRSELAKRTSK